MRAPLIACAVLALVCFASAHSLIPPVSAPADLGALKPRLECVSTATGTVTAYFGWTNPSINSLNVPAGTNNKFVPEPSNRSQTTVFQPGASRYFPIYAFAVTFGSSASATWQLNGYQVTANSSSSKCITDYECFVMTVASQMAPSAAQAAAVAASAATAMNVDASRVATAIHSAGLGYFEIVFNVTSVDDEDATTPVLAISNLFGDNARFATFIETAVTAGLTPTSTEPMASGLEVEGTLIPSTPPTAPTSPATPSSAPSGSTPSTTPGSTTPSGSTPSATPSAAPRAANTPAGDASTKNVASAIFLSAALLLAISWIF